MTLTQKLPVVLELTTNAHYDVNLRVMIDIEGPLRYFSISLIGGGHIGASALLVIKLIWYGPIAHLVGRREVFYLFIRCSECTDCKNLKQNHVNSLEITKTYFKHHIT